jgi:hypothetical protein
MMMLASSNGTASNGVISRETAIQGQAAGDKETDRDGENDLILSGLSGSAWLAESHALLRRPPCGAARATPGTCPVDAQSILVFFCHN